MPTLEMIQTAVHQAAAEYPVKRVELFGSYANGTADADSDVDLLKTLLLSFKSAACAKRFRNFFIWM